MVTAVVSLDEGRLRCVVVVVRRVSTVSVSTDDWGEGDARLLAFAACANDVCALGVGGTSSTAG